MRPEDDGRSKQARERAPARRTVGRRAVLLALPIACVTAGTAAATPLGDPSVSSCTSENCSSVAMGGTVLGFGASYASPWVAEIFADNECLRLDVLAQAADLEMTVVAPNAFTYVNDDRNSAGDKRPLVKIDGGQRGWYTVSVSRFDGNAADADFTLAFGRYNRTNPNCASPTAPTPALVGQAAKARVADTSPRPTGGPGGR